MPVCVLRLPPLPEQVRTARLVAAAAARRLGLDEDVQDDVRLAVGEATARAVLRHDRAGIDADVVVTLEDGPAAFTVDVEDVAPYEEAATERYDGADAPALALLHALADRADRVPAESGERIRLVWDLPIG